ncbi:MAG: STAS/SEC14 domain-containing protein [Amphritea sp.]
MLNVELDEATGIATLTPDGTLSVNDFLTASVVIDPYIEKSGRLRGLIINTREFPGWESFGALIKHFKFVKEHHNKVSHVAIVTDSVLGDFAEKVVEHFVAAEIKHFAFGELSKAHSWILHAESK